MRRTLLVLAVLLLLGLGFAGGLSLKNATGLWVNGGEIQANLWEGSRGAGPQPPLCEPRTSDGLGRWDCLVFYGDPGEPNSRPAERVTVEVSGNGALIGSARGEVFPPAASKFAAASGRSEIRRAIRIRQTGGGRRVNRVEAASSHVATRPAPRTQAAEAVPVGREATMTAWRSGCAFACFDEPRASLSGSRSWLASMRPAHAWQRLA